MKNNLFNDDNYTAAAEELHEETRAALQPIFERLAREGYSIREVAAVMSWAVRDIETEQVLDRAPKA